jgi:hypothetical protein
MRLLASLSLLILIFSQAAQCQYGLPDSILFGNLDQSIINVIPGHQISIPVWVKTDDSVVDAKIYYATKDGFMASHDSIILYQPLSRWDQVNYSRESIPMPVGYLSDGFSALECIDTACHPEDYLFTNYQWQHVADFRMTPSLDTSLIGDTKSIISGCDFWCETPFFGMVDGLHLEVPFTVPCPLRYVLSSVVPGDANGDCRVNGIDVVYLVNYLKGIGQPPSVGNCP